MRCFKLPWRPLVLHLEVELVALSAVVFLRLVLQVAERAVAVVGRLMRIRIEAGIGLFRATWRSAPKSAAEAVVPKMRQALARMRARRFIFMGSPRVGQNLSPEAGFVGRIRRRFGERRRKGFYENQQPLNFIAVRAATRPKIMQSATATVPRRTMPWTPPVTSPAA